MIWGNHKWKGGIPALIIRVMRMIVSELSIDQEEAVKLLKLIEEIINKEAIAWAMKYLIALSVREVLILIIIMGVIIIKLISRPNQAVNQVFEEIATIEPVIIHKINIIWLDLINIIKKDLFL